MNSRIPQKSKGSGGISNTIVCFYASNSKQIQEEDSKFLKTTPEDHQKNIPRGSEAGWRGLPIDQQTMKVGLLLRIVDIRGHTDDAW